MAIGLDDYKRDKESKNKYDPFRSSYIFSCLCGILLCDNASLRALAHYPRIAHILILLQ